MPTPPGIQGSVAPGFEPVADAFARNFAERREVGAAVAAYHRGVKVVDLWGGLRDPKQGLPWQSDTMAVVFSTTKGMSAAAMALAYSRGLFDLDQPIARYWPEFGQAGKERITVRQLLAHEAGLVTLDPLPTPEVVADPAALADLLARQRPLWEPGTRHGYHAITLGWYQSQLLRRVDPQGRSVGQFFRDEVAAPLGAEFHIGLPLSVSDDRLAALQWPGMSQFIFGGGFTFRSLLSFINRKSLFWRAMGVLTSLGDGIFSRDFLVHEVPSGTGVGEARALARVYSAMAAGELGYSPAAIAELTRPVAGGFDPVCGMDMAFSMGYSRPWGRFQFGSDAGSFGCPGLGGSFGFADVKAQVGFGYICNQIGVQFVDDPRARELWQTLYRCVEQHPSAAAS